MKDGGLFDEDGSVLCRAGRHFGRIAGPIKEGNKLARLGHQRDDDHTRAPIHLTGQDRGWQQDSQREREREKERERERRKPQRAGPTGGRGQTLRRVLISLLITPPEPQGAHRPGPGADVPLHPKRRKNRFFDTRLVRPDVPLHRRAVRFGIRYGIPQG